MVTITGDETIGQVMKAHPKAAGVMLKYGLHCVGCHVNQYESIRQGAMGHGMPEDLVTSMIDELNTTLNKKIETLEVTPEAREMIRNYAIEDGKEGWGLKVTVSETEQGFAYDMEFIQGPADGDEVFDFDGVQIFVDQESYKNLKGSEIDFVQTMEESGFRIDNPNSKKAVESE